MAKKFLLKENLTKNINNLKANLPCGCKFCAVVKSNAYGHGVKNVVETIDNFVDYFAVANVMEAKEVQLFTRKPILILCDDFDNLKNLNAEIGVYDISQITKLKQINQHFDIHIAIDSGMNRLGIKTKKDLNKIVKECKRAKNITIKGFFSHLSDGENFERCKMQLAKFLSLSPKNNFLHIASSNFEKLNKDFSLDMVRFGLALYSNKRNDTMRVTAKILQIKKVNKNEYIGYGSKILAKSKMNIAIINIGYADGFLRANVGGDVLVCGERCKILNVCMSLTLIDLGNKKCDISDEVVVLGKGENDCISSQEIATRCGTIPYEVLTNFSKLQ
jgi:alanine racemase